MVQMAPFFLEAQLLGAEACRNGHSALSALIGQVKGCVAGGWRGIRRARENQACLLACARLREDAQREPPDRLHADDQTSVSTASAFFCLIITLFL